MFGASGVFVLAGMAGIYTFGAIGDIGPVDNMRISPAIFAHSVGLFCAWLYGWGTIPLLAPGCTLLILLSASMGHPHLESQATSHMLLLLIAPLSFRVMRWAGVSVGLGSNVTQHSWKQVLLGAGKASATTYLLTAVICETAGWSGFEGTSVALKTVLDILALVVLMTILMLGFRWMRHRSQV